MLSAVLGGGLLAVAAVAVTIVLSLLLLTEERLRLPGNVGHELIALCSRCR